MNKNELVSFIKKYHLGGICNNVKFSILDGVLTVKFISDAKNMLGDIQLTEVDLNNGEFGIFNTSSFIKLISILDDDIQVAYSTTRHIITNILISDKDFNINYATADTSLTPTYPDIELPEEWVVDMEIGDEFVGKFLKAKSALKNEDSNNLMIESSLGKLTFTLGEDSNYSNKIDFTYPYEIRFEQIKFPLTILSSILSNNKDTLGQLKISSEGLMHLHFKSNKITNNYYLIANES